MFDLKDKQFIFRQSGGDLQNIYYDTNSGLRCSRLLPGNRWNRIIPVKKDVHPDFFACMDSRDNIHVFLQDKQGNLFVSSMAGGSFSSVPVLSGKHPSQYDKHLTVLPVNTDLCLFYVLQYNNSSLLSYQLCRSGGAENPKAIDYISTEYMPPYCVTMDSSQDIYIFYTASENGKHQPGYRRLSAPGGGCSEFIPLDGCNETCKYFSSLSDGNNILHICYQRTVETRGQARHELMYRQKIAGRNQWTEAITLHTSMYEFSKMHILLADGQLFSYWVRNGSILYCMSEDNGQSWSKPSQYLFPAGRQLLCIYYRTNRIGEKPSANLNPFPGTLLGGLKLAFCTDSSQKLISLPFEDFKKNITNTLEELKGNTEKLQSLQLELEKRLLSFEAVQQKIVKELIKSNVRIEIMEKNAGKE